MNASDISLYNSYKELAEKHGLFIDLNGQYFSIRFRQNETASEHLLADPTSGYDFLELRELTSFIDGFLVGKAI